MPEKIQDFFLTCKECILENPRSFYGSFRIGPFSNSQSLTVANALRRTLLSEFSTVSITHLEIQDFLHEYTTFEGIRESGIDLFLNFKQILLQTSEPFDYPVYGYLHVRGPGVVRASDLKLPPFVQLIDPDQYIATLSENGNLKIRFRISTREHDKSFSCGSIEVKENNEGQNNSSLLPVNELLKNLKPRGIWIDPLFSPILKVNYLIERIEPFQLNQPKNIFTTSSFVQTESTNLSPFGKTEEVYSSMPMEVIFLEIWTNGSLHPRQALYKTLNYLKKMFENLDRMQTLNYEFLQTTLESEKFTTKVLQTFEQEYQASKLTEKKQTHEVSLKTKFGQKETTQTTFGSQFFENERKITPEAIPLKTLNLPTRIVSCFQKNNIFTTNDLMNYSFEELKKFPGIGNYAIYCLQKSLKEQHITLKKK